MYMCDVIIRVLCDRWHADAPTMLLVIGTLIVLVNADDGDDGDDAGASKLRASGDPDDDAMINKKTSSNDDDDDADDDGDGDVDDDDERPRFAAIRRYSSRLYLDRTRRPLASSSSPSSSSPQRSASQPATRRRLRVRIDV